MADVVEEVLRSPAAERRLRLRRQEARLRVKMLSDAYVLNEHRASAAPCFIGPMHAQSVASIAGIACLRGNFEAMRQQLGALGGLLGTFVHQHDAS